MNSDYEWYPKDAPGQVTFQESLAKNILALAEKYDIPKATTDRIAANAKWLRFWFDYRTAFDLQSEQFETVKHFGTRNSRSSV